VVGHFDTTFSAEIARLALPYNPAMKPHSLHKRILAALHETGPISVGQLALKLSEPFGMVLVALERLRDTDKHIRVLPGGLWDVTDEHRKGSRSKSNSKE
jgi:hypothetical protein